MDILIKNKSTSQELENTPFATNVDNASSDLHLSADDVAYSVGHADPSSHDIDLSADDVAPYPIELIPNILLTRYPLVFLYESDSPHHKNPYQFLGYSLAVHGFDVYYLNIRKAGADKETLFLNWLKFNSKKKFHFFASAENIEWIKGLNLPPKTTVQFQNYFRFLDCFRLKLGNPIQSLNPLTSELVYSKTNYCKESVKSLLNLAKSLAEKDHSC